MASLLRDAHVLAGLEVADSAGARARVGAPCWRAQAVVEAEAGTFARWGMCPGQQLEMRT